MAFFTRRGASSVPEIPLSTASTTHNSSIIDKEMSEEDTKKFNYLLDRDGVEV
jgi:hypothetical protein